MITALTIDDALPQSDIALARRHPNLSVEFWMTDSTSGEPIRQGQFHEILQNHISESWADGKIPGILAPMGSGKSAQALGRVSHEIGRNQNEQCQIICNTDDNSKKRIAVLKNVFQRSQPYRAIFPEVKPDYKAGWQKHEIFVQRNVVSIAPTVMSYGITSSGTGSRSTLSVFDDVVDYDNAVGSPAEREAVKDKYEHTWLTRIVESGRALYIGTPYHQEDLIHNIIGKDTYSWLVVNVSDDLDHLCVRRGRAAADYVLRQGAAEPERRIPLLSYFSRQKLDDLKVNLAPLIFGACYHLQAIGRGDIYYPNFCNALALGAGKSWSSLVNNEWPRITGVDPGGEGRPGNALFTFAVAPNGQRIPIDLRLGNWGYERFIDQLLDVWLVHHPSITVVENNGIQQKLIDSIKGYATHQNTRMADGKPYPPRVQAAWATIQPHPTGANKHDIHIGLPSMDLSFKAGQYIIPGADIGAHPSASTDGHCPWAKWVADMQTYPAHVGKFDLGMAFWFAHAYCEKSMIPGADDWMATDHKGRTEYAKANVEW